MAQSKRKRKAELREKQQEKAFFTWTAIITVICVVLAFAYFLSN